MAGFTEEKAKEILNRFPGELSDGERHRVALAQVLIREPRLVILDEPTGTMDPITKQDVKHSILNARDEMDETFIVVSHDMDFVRDICDRVALMRGGKIIDIGPTAAILAQVTEESDDEKTDDFSQGFINDRTPDRHNARTGCRRELQHLCFGTAAAQCPKRAATESKDRCETRYPRPERERRASGNQPSPPTSLPHSRRTAGRSAFSISTSTAPTFPRCWVSRTSGRPCWKTTWTRSM